MRALMHILLGSAAALLGLALMWVMLQLPPKPIHLAPRVAAHLDASGVTNPVTAVLLNFRGYDTLLEVAVLFLALLGILAVAPDGASQQAPVSGESHGAPLQAITRWLAPLMVLVAGYLLWAGTAQPGGAFQAGAVLAIAPVLLHLAGWMPHWEMPGRLLRSGLVAGFLFFLGVAVLLLQQGALLQYPPQSARMLIVMIEAMLTLSLALILAGLYLWQPHARNEAENTPKAP